MKWEKVKLEDVSTIIAGQSPESKYYNQTGQGLPFFQGKADFGLETPNVRYWCTEPTKIAHPLDILLSVRAPVGPTNICNIESCIGRGLAAVRVGKKLNYRYLYWWFKSFEKQLSSMGNGSTFSAITTKVVKDLEVPLPPLHIQEQIAETLDKADALYRKDQDLLDKYEELAKAFFYEMFGDPIRNEKGWKKYKLGDLCNIKRGASPRPIDKFIGNDVPWIKIGDATKGDDMFITKTKVRITTEGSKKSILIKPDDLIFANCGVSLGFARISKITGCIHDGWLALEIKDTKILNQVYLLKLINGLTNYLRGLAPEGTQPNLNIGIMKELEIIVPPIVLQQKYSGINEQFYFSKRNLELALMKSNTLFNTLSHKSFS